MTMDALQEQVLSYLDKEELVQMTKDVVNIDSPTGGEEAIGNYLATRFADLGLPVQKQEVEPGRNNVIATWKGFRGRPRRPLPWPHGLRSRHWQARSPDGRRQLDCRYRRRPT